MQIQLRSIELFLHEIGHSLEGKIFDLTLSNKEKEYYCDEFAFTWIMYLYQTGYKIIDISLNNNLGLIAPLMFLYLCDYVDYVKIKYGYRVVRDDFHPTFKERIIKLKQKYIVLPLIQKEILDNYKKT